MSFIRVGVALAALGLVAGGAQAAPYDKKAPPKEEPQSQDPYGQPSAPYPQQPPLDDGDAGPKPELKPRGDGYRPPLPPKPVYQTAGSRLASRWMTRFERFNETVSLPRGEAHGPRVGANEVDERTDTRRTIRRTVTLINPQGEPITVRATCYNAGGGGVFQVIRTLQPGQVWPDATNEAAAASLGPDRPAPAKWCDFVADAPFMAYGQARTEDEVKTRITYILPTGGTHYQEWHTVVSDETELLQPVD